MGDNSGGLVKSIAYFFLFYFKKTCYCWLVFLSVLESTFLLVQAILHIFGVPVFKIGFVAAVYVLVHTFLQFFELSLFLGNPHILKLFVFLYSPFFCFFSVLLR